MAEQPSNRQRIGAWADFVYLRRGRVAHVSPFHAHRSVLCGRAPQAFESWLGTGSQGEIDKARQMPLCVRCLERSGGRTR